VRTYRQEALADEFERHADQEGHILAEYRNLADDLGDTAAGVLVNQILTDEEIHHLLLRTMAGWLRAQSVGAETMRVPQDANRAELLRRTHMLQEHERETIEACRELQPRLSGDMAGLLGTLLDVLILDSQKHERLLRAVERILTSA